MWRKWSLGFFFFLKFEVSILRIVKLKKKNPSNLKILEHIALQNSGAAMGCGWDPDLEKEFFLVIINKQFIICYRYFYSYFLYHRLMIFSVSKAVGVASLGCHKLFCCCCCC